MVFFSGVLTIKLLVYPQNCRYIPIHFLGNLILDIPFSQLLLPIKRLRKSLHPLPPPSLDHLPLIYSLRTKTFLILLFLTFIAPLLLPPLRSTMTPILKVSKRFFLSNRPCI